MQRHAQRNNTAKAVPPIVDEVLHSSGQPLPAQNRAFFEARFGHDFSNVRVHTDKRAAESATAVQAHAYTVGQDIVFGAAQYAPGTSAGDRLLAHELTHLVQGQGVQRGGSVQSISSPADPAEHEAERAADACMSGAVMPAQTASSQGLFRLGANPNCSKDDADAIHQAIFDARSWLNKAIPALEKSPLDAKVLASLRHNFGPTYGVAANASLIHDRLVAARTAVGTIPYSCAKGSADAMCAAKHCGHTPPAAGSHQVTICTDITIDGSHDPVFRAGCVLHESFHATFSAMGIDFYSGWHGHSTSTSGYPGGRTSPLLNADSYTTLAMDLS